MQPSKPKLSIPPLFPKETVELGKQEEDSVEMVNFHSMFSSDDESAKRAFKKIVKKQLRHRLLIQ